jgi:hypothetical protein
VDRCNRDLKNYQDFLDCQFPKNKFCIKCGLYKEEYLEKENTQLTALQQALAESNEINFRLAMQINELDIKVQKEQQAHRLTLAELQELRGKLKEIEFVGGESSYCPVCLKEEYSHDSGCWLKTELDKIGGVE